MAEEQHQDNDPTFVAKKRNPIIFARTETSHIPRTLQHLQHPKELQNAVYSAHVDGSLKRTPSSLAVEEERQAEQTTESLSVLVEACLELLLSEIEGKRGQGGFANPLH
ncbi:hypothetical protein BLSTO_06517 [Blastocystis sp. subtype 1]